MPIMTNTTYNCSICNKSSPQKSHHQTHINSEGHKNKCKILSLELEKKTLEELQKEYPIFKIENKNNLIKAIVESKEMETIVVSKKTEMEKKIVTNINQQIKFYGN